MWLIFGLLSTFSWAIVNIFNSIFVHNYVKSPLVINWIQSIITLIILLVISIFIETESSLIPMLIFFGITAYAGDLWFFHSIKLIDISIINASWSIMALFLSVCGFIFFGESWNIYQFFGAILIIIGTLLLTFYHKHIHFLYTFGILTTLAILYVPFYVAKKYALDNGESISAVFFWTLIGRELVSVCMPFVFPWIITESVKTIKKGWYFPFSCLGTIFLYFLAEYFGTLAFKMGPLSLVSVIENIQPFAVMLIAWIMIFFFPNKMPKELITKQSIIVKIVSFSTALIGILLISKAL